MKPHYLQSARFGHLNQLLWHHRKDIDWKNNWHYIARIYGYSAFLELPGLLERGLYHTKIENTKIEHPPVFILGHWRSGTTFLFNLLSLDPETAFMDSVDTFTFDHILTMSWILYPFFGNALDGSRPGDTMEWSAESPQEEAYTMACLSEVSCSHMISFPSQAQRYIDLNFPGKMNPEQRRKWVQGHRYILKKMTYAKKGKRILFKSPDNTAKTGLLYRMYPGAKFINIYRDPYKVLMSSLKTIKEGIEQCGLEAMPSDDWMEDMAIAQFQEMYRQYFADCKKIPSNQLIEIAYSDLTKAPLQTLEQIYTALELPGFEAARPFFEAHIASQKNYQVNRLVMEPRLHRKINERLGDYFEHYHFEMKPLEVEE